MTKGRNPGNSGPVGPVLTKTEALAAEVARLKAENAALRASRNATTWGKVLQELIKWSAVGFTTYYSVSALSGKVTKVDAAVSLDSPAVAEALESVEKMLTLWIVLLVFIGISILSNLRKDRLIRSLNERIGIITEQYEQLWDKDRTTSGLGTDGLTHERDG
jgi:hypothetical protein